MSLLDTHTSTVERARTMRLNVVGFLFRFWLARWRPLPGMDGLRVSNAEGGWEA